MIEVKNINKSFGSSQILHDVSIKLKQGEVNLIIGASGSGKSVLTKCIVGLHEVDSGEVLYDDRDFVQMNFKERKKIYCKTKTQTSETIKVCIITYCMTSDCNQSRILFNLFLYYLINDVA